MAKKAVKKKVTERKIEIGSRASSLEWIDSANQVGIPNIHSEIMSLESKYKSLKDQMNVHVQAQAIRHTGMEEMIQLYNRQSVEMNLVYQERLDTLLDQSKKDQWRFVETVNNKIDENKLEININQKICIGMIKQMSNEFVAYRKRGFWRRLFNMKPKL